MRCPECNGDGFTYNNPEDMSRVSRSVGGTFQPAWVCWKCKGEGSLTMITIDKEMLAMELANDKMRSMGYNTDERYNSLGEQQIFTEFYLKYIEMIEEQEI
jgi:hypothetical protein